MSRAGNWLKKTTRQAVYLRDGYRCGYCGQQPPAHALSLDHTDGPDKHSPRHLITACLSCNSSRKDTPIRPWCESRGLNASVVWRRIRALQARDVRPYREAIRTLRARGIDVHALVLDPSILDPFTAPAAPGDL